MKLIDQSLRFFLLDVLSGNGDCISRSSDPIVYVGFRAVRVRLDVYLGKSV